jgi:hypothetical protein
MAPEPVLNAVMERAVAPLVVMVAETVVELQLLAGESEVNRGAGIRDDVGPADVGLGFEAFAFVAFTRTRVVTGSNLNI